MPYVPPHLRPGFVAPKIEPIDYTGRIHWPTNVNTHLETNVVQPLKLHSPTRESLGLGVKKPILKLSMPIKTNTRPLARPTMKVSKFPKKFRTAVLHHMKSESLNAEKYTRRSKRRYTETAPSKKYNKSKKRHTRKFRG
jgi:hypothetical protein